MKNKCIARASSHHTYRTAVSVSSARRATRDADVSKPGLLAVQKPYPSDITVLCSYVYTGQSKESGKTRIYADELRGLNIGTALCAGANRGPRSLSFPSVSPRQVPLVGQRTPICRLGEHHAEMAHAQQLGVSDADATATMRGEHH